MGSSERNNLVAPCGIDCGICELNMAKTNEPLRRMLVSKGILKNGTPCEGCRNIEGNCPVINDKCETYLCVQEHKVEFCFECGEFPCSKLNPSSDRADVLPHNTKVFNLCTIKRDGVDTFITKSNEIKAKYYKGKMAVGKGPQII